MRVMYIYNQVGCYGSKIKTLKMFYLGTTGGQGVGWGHGGCGGHGGGFEHKRPCLSTSIKVVPSFPSRPGIPGAPGGPGGPGGPAGQ